MTILGSEVPPEEQARKDAERNFFDPFMFSGDKRKVYKEVFIQKREELAQEIGVHIRSK